MCSHAGCRSELHNRNMHCALPQDRDYQGAVLAGNPHYHTFFREHFPTGSVFHPLARWLLRLSEPLRAKVHAHARRHFTPHTIGIHMRLLKVLTSLHACGTRCLCHGATPLTAIQGPWLAPERRATDQVSDAWTVALPGPFCQELQPTTRSSTACMHMLRIGRRQGGEPGTIYASWTPPPSVEAYAAAAAALAASYGPAAAVHFFVSGDSPAAFAAVAEILGAEKVSFGAGQGADLAATTAAGNPGTEAGAMADLALLAECRDVVVTAGCGPVGPAFCCRFCILLLAECRDMVVTAGAL